MSCCARHFYGRTSLELPSVPASNDSDSAAVHYGEENRGDRGQTEGQTEEQRVDDESFACDYKHAFGKSYSDALN